ncbi:MAG: hypothetical protein SVW02_02655, partial [Candidatus Nanohaloarchaea archaeon]|nr:hypothetical protein [Candidatus Nanohaloarchaea archaeon]
ALARIVGPDTVAASVDTSPMIEEAGAEVVYSRVGDIFVAASGMEADADLLGEPNGHYAVPQFSWYNSGIFASLLLASAAEQLPGILAEVDDYSTVRRTTVFDTEEERDEALSTVKKRVAEQYDVTSRIDGVKFRGDGFTGLVRPSGTSPKLRVVVHAASEGVNPERVAERLLP